MFFKCPLLLIPLPTDFSDSYFLIHCLQKECGLHKIYPNSKVDSFLFDPCGYSVNGLLSKYYWTVHITPEKVCSYASFETNIPLSATRYNSYQELVEDVVKIVGAGSVSVSLFTRSQRHSECRIGKLKGRRKMDEIRLDLGAWDLWFGHWVKESANTADETLER